MGTSTEAGSRAGDTAPRAFVVRPAEPKDAASFLQMWRAVIAERKYVRTERASQSVRFYRRRYFRRSWSNDQASIVAVQGDRVIGHLNVSREDSPVTRHVASIGMAVASDWRGNGVGSALMSEAIRWGHQFGVEKLALSVYPDNEGALALYRKFGFQEEGRLTGHSKKSIGYRDEVVMGLWLIERPRP